MGTREEDMVELSCDELFILVQYIFGNVAGSVCVTLSKGGENHA